MLISLENCNGCRQTANSEDWRTYGGSFDWTDHTQFSIVYGPDEFDVNIDIDAREHRVDINGKVRVVPTAQVIPTVRLALSCAVLRHTRLVGGVDPI